MHRKRVTSELHDSYFRLMTIKHSISKIQWTIVWALNYYIIQLSSSPRSSCQQNSRELETRCGREGHTRPRGTSESPNGVDPNIRRTRKTQRDGHNSGVKIWSLCSVSSTLSHATLEQPFRTLAIKSEVKILLKKSSCVFLHASFIPASFCVRLSLLLCRCDAAWTCKWLSNTSRFGVCASRVLQGFKTNLVTVNDSF